MRKRIIGIALLAVSAILLFAGGDRVYLSDDDPTEPYYHSIMDKDGFCIADGILYTYLSKDREITIPETVAEIYTSALSGDFDHGDNLKQVIVPGTVKKIDNGAFAFTFAKKIIVQEGVKEIEEWAFGDSYIEEIWFPSSLEKIGNGIMETEEGLDGTKIHVPKNSKISQYFEQNMPYGNAELIYDGDENIFEASNYDYVLMYGSPQLWDDEKNLSVDVNGDGASEEFIISKDFNDGIILKGVRRKGQEEVGKSMNFWTSNLSGLLPKSLKKGDSISDNCFVQISCCDIDEDGTKEVLVSAGDKQSANVTAIYEYSESGAIPFKYCGYISCGTIVWYKDDNVLWAYRGDTGNQYDEYIYKDEKLESLQD